MAGGTGVPKELLRTLTDAEARAKEAEPDPDSPYSEKVAFHRRKHTGVDATAAVDLPVCEFVISCLWKSVDLPRELAPRGFTSLPSGQLGDLRCRAWSSGGYLSYMRGAPSEHRGAYVERGEVVIRDFHVDTVAMQRGNVVALLEPWPDPKFLAHSYGVGSDGYVFLPAWRWALHVAGPSQEVQAAVREILELDLRTGVRGDLEEALQGAIAPAAPATTA